MGKHAQTIRRLTNCLNVFDYFVWLGLARSSHYLKTSVFSLESMGIIMFEDRLQVSLLNIKQIWSN